MAKMGGKESKDGKGYKDYKKAFYSQLESVYLGVKIKDFHQQNAAKSGFNNLLSIKSEYFGEVKRRLEAKIAELFGENGDSGSAFLGVGQSANADKNGFSNNSQSKNTDKNSPKSDTNAEKNELYNKLYTFFDSYLNDTGTPFFNDTPIYKNIYARIYSNSKDTALFYKTQNLYYVKSDTLYESASLQDGRFGVVFDASEFAQSADNAKNKVNFWLVGVENLGFEGENSQNSVNFSPNSQNSTKTSQNSQNNNFADAKFTHPQTAGAREGALNAQNSQNSTKTSQNPAQTSQIPQNPQFTLTIKVSSQKALFDGLLSVFKTNSNEFSDDFLKALIDKGALDKKPKDADTASLKKLFAAYKKQNEVDFFIHKNAGEFLKEQFDLFFYGYIFKDEHTQWEFERIDFLKKLREIALYAIKLIADFENELKALWLKPKFAKTTQFVFSIDAILRHAKDAPTLLERVFADEGFENQIAEWRELGLIAQNPTLKGILEDENSRFLPIDTKFLSKEGKNALLCGFEDLRAVLCGELIKGDNFQALNTLMPKYQGRVDLIYIDPPYNTGNDDFIYADKFNHASWLSMISSRLELAKNLLNDKGSIFVSIDDNEQANLKLLMDNIFGNENFISNIIWRKRAGGGNDSKHIAIEQDYIFLYAKNINLLVTNGIGRTNIKQYKRDDKGHYAEKPLNDTALQDSVGLHYDIQLPNGKILKGNEHQWKMAESTFLARLERNEIIFKPNDKVYYKHYIDINSNLVPTSIWYDLALNADATQDIKHLFGDKNFNTPKPEKLISRIVEIASKENSTILDFFAGSGTTCAVALKLGRKFVGVEMGEHFYKVILPRLKKVIAGVQSGISKECGFKGGGAFCYYELESYEDVLAEFEYVLSNDSIIDYRKSRKLIKELNKENDKPITLNMSGYRAEFDVFQTIANLMGWKIKRLFLDNGVECCEYHNGEILNAQNIDITKYPKLKNLIFWDKE